jgi:hypothetical protein
MKFLRLKLSTFLILTAVLPATFGMLYRYGQLDLERETFSQAGYWRWHITLFGYGALIDENSLTLVTHTAWELRGGEISPLLRDNPCNLAYRPAGWRRHVEIIFGDTMPPAP